MKYKLLLFIGGVILFLGCKLPEDSGPKKEVRFIFLFDRIDETVIAGFDKVFFNIVDTLQEEITQRLPKNISDISFEVYNAANKNAVPLVLSLSEMDDKDAKEDKARKFISQLETDTSKGRDYRSNYVFRNIERILSSIDEGTVVYRVALFSRLIENSGDINGNGTHEAAAMQGNFHFVSGSNICVKGSIVAADSQVNNKTSWIYRHLVKPAQARPWLSTIPINIYGSNEPEPRADEQGTDSKTIEEFWEELFYEMGLNVRRQAPVNLTEYRFFK